MGYARWGVFVDVIIGYRSDGSYGIGPTCSLGLRAVDSCATGFGRRDGAASPGRILGAIPIAHSGNWSDFPIF